MALDLLDRPVGEEGGEVLINVDALVVDLGLGKMQIFKRRPCPDAPLILRLHLVVVLDRVSPPDVLPGASQRVEFTAAVVAGQFVA